MAGYRSCHVVMTIYPQIYKETMLLMLRLVLEKMQELCLDKSWLLDHEIAFSHNALCIPQLMADKNKLHAYSTSKLPVLAIFDFFIL